jgi:hypothetical protein
MDEIKKKKKTVRIISGLFLISLVISGIIYYLFFDINRIRGQEYLFSSSSPNGEYEIAVYRNNGGATTGYAYLCIATSNKTQRKRNIYWDYRIDKINIDWLSDYTVRINSRELDVRFDAYDFRKDG